MTAQKETPSTPPVAENDRVETRLEDYPVEVLEAVLKILKGRGKQRPPDHAGVENAGSSTGEMFS